MFLTEIMGYSKKITSAVSREKFIMTRIKALDNMLDAYFEGSSKTFLVKCSVGTSVATSIFLVVIKLLAWLVTDSISMQASMNDSILDALSSFMAFHALKFSYTSYDEDHNYGHEKVEGLVALVQCALVIYSGFVIFKESYEVFLDPRPISNTSTGIAVMIISLIAVFQLVYFQQYVAIKTESMIVKGDSLHYLSDLFMNACILLSLFLSKYFVYVDVICGLCVGSYVLYSAILIIKTALRDLMDESLSVETQKDVRKNITSVSGVKSIALLRTRSAGMKKYIESEVEVDRDLSLIAANEICEQVEQKVRDMFDRVDVVIKPVIKSAGVN